MNLIANRMRGMQDILPGEVEKWEYIEKIMKEQAELCGFKLIRTPVVESTGLFKRATGEASDIVEKEMYTFKDKGNREVSLRPEGTAGVIRAVLENGMHNQVLPLKLMYISSCYRYEKPQSGRFREFFQFGVEAIGGNSAVADAEIIFLAKNILEKLGLKNIQVQINAIGCVGCQGNYMEYVKSFFKSNEKFLCDTCRSRLERSPLRIFDCKNKSCKEILNKAPLSLAYICPDCADHFQRVKDYTNAFGIDAKVNPYLFRGLDYYTKTVFEFIDTESGDNLAVCGGGRYDNLSQELGGPKLTSVGFGIGMERLLSVMDRQNVQVPQESPCEIYIAPLGEPARCESIKIAKSLRQCGFKAEIDLVGRFIKPQMRYANKLKAKFTMVLGADEIDSRKAILKNMQTGTQTKINLNENFVEEFKRIFYDSQDSQKN